MYSKHLSMICLLALLGISMNAERAKAQSIWLEPISDNEIQLEILKPSFAEDGYFDQDYTYSTLTCYLSGRFALGEKTRLVGELPFAHAATKNGTTSDSALGNLYLGAEFGRVRSGIQGDLGIRVPTAPSNNLAAAVGALSDYVDRFEAFLPEKLSVIAAARYRHRSAEGFGLGARLAPVLSIDTNWSVLGTRSEEVTWSMLFSLMAWYENDKVGVGGGFSGRLLLKTNDLNSGDRADHQLGLFAKFILDRWMPGIQVRIPLSGDVADHLAPAISLSVGVKLG